MYQGVDMSLIRVTMDDGDTVYDVIHGLGAPAALTVPGSVLPIMLPGPFGAVWPGLYEDGTAGGISRWRKVAGVGTGCTFNLFFIRVGGRSNPFA
jgi:hypothetical protein